MIPTEYRYVSFAHGLDNLTGSQLESLLLLVGQKYCIRISKGWNVDKEEYGIIFLIKDADYQKLEVADKINLDRWKKWYERAIDDFGVDATVIAPHHVVLCFDSCYPFCTSLYACAIRSHAISKYCCSRSMPINRRLCRAQATAVLPLGVFS